MLEKINLFLSNVPMTIVSGVFLAASLVLLLTDTSVAVDPAWLAVLISGLPLVYLAVRRLIKNVGMSKISSALLISIAMIAAIAIGDVFAAGEVAFIMAIGAILEDKTAERSKKGLKALISLAPQQGRLLRDGTEQLIAVAEIKAGDRLRVLPGETIPVDGTVESGTTSVDQAIMTGESLPVDKTVGDSVYGGTINRFGSIDLCATHVGADSSLQKLIRMVEEAEEKKAPIQRIADKWATWLVPVALLIAVLTYAATGQIVRAVTVLVVFCPCALVMATPTAIMAAIGQATKHGVIIKSGEALENMGNADFIAFDKTGTLTHGALTVSDLIPLDGDAVALLQAAAAAEMKSEHPLGKAIVLRARDEDVPFDEPSEFAMTAGRGVTARVNGRAYVVGNESFLVQAGIAIPPAAADALDALRADGKAAVLVAGDGNCLGVIGLSDTIRPAAASLVQALHRMGAKTVLLTGDHHRAAAHIAGQAGIETVKADLLPEAKVAGITELQQSGHTVCMVGDGVNDAPALKTATVGVAMAAMGSDIAVEAADIALMSDDLSRLVYLKRLSNATVRTIRFGIFLSLFINVVAILLSFFGWLTPTTGALVHNGGSILVVLIAALLYERRFD